MKKEALLLVVIYLSTSNAKKVCYVLDVEFSSCIEEEAQKYFASLDEEAEPDWEPINKTIVKGPISIQTVYNVDKFINTTNGIAVALNYDFPTKTLSGTIHAPHVGMESIFKVKGFFGKLDVSGEGKADAHIYDMDASFNAHLISGTGNNLEIEDLNFTINKIKKFTLNLRDIKSKNKGIETAFNQLSAVAPDIFFTMFKDECTELLKLHYRFLAREFLKKLFDEGVIESHK